MPITKPSLIPVTPGQPLTAGGWNAVVDGVEGVYDGLNQSGRDYIEVTLTFRGQPVGNASVVGTPVDGNGTATGPALAAIPPVADFTTYQLVGISPGMWNIAIAAEGFEPAGAKVQVAGLATSGPSGSTQLELKRTTVPAPDVVGMPSRVANYLTQRAGLTTGIWKPFVGTGNWDDDTSYIVMQAPSNVEVPRGTPINALYTGPDANLGLDRFPWRTTVADYLGYPAAGAFAASISAGQFHLAKGQETGTGGSGSRVVAQNPLPGAIVAAGTAVDLSYAPTDDQTKFGLYPRTHAALAATLVKDVLTRLNASTDSFLANSKKFYAASWDVARTYWADDNLNSILSFFSPFNVTVLDPSKDLPAIWASFVVVLAHSLAA